MRHKTHTFLNFFFLHLGLLVFLFLPYVNLIALIFIVYYVYVAFKVSKAKGVSFFVMYYQLATTLKDEATNEITDTFLKSISKGLISFFPLKVNSIFNLHIYGICFGFLYLMGELLYYSWTDTPLPELQTGSLIMLYSFMTFFVTFIILLILCPILEYFKIVDYD